MQSLEEMKSKLIYVMFNSTQIEQLQMPLTFIIIIATKLPVHVKRVKKNMGDDNNV